MRVKQFHFFGFFRQFFNCVSQIVFAVCCLAGTPVFAAAPQPVKVAMQWLPQAQFAGMYVADELGFYLAEGLDVSFVYPSSTYLSSEILADGNADFAVALFVDALRFCDQGKKLVNVLQLNQQSNIMIVSQEPISDIRELDGKRIGRWSQGEYSLDRLLNRKFDLKAEWLRINHGVSVMTAQAVDAMLAMEYNEYNLLAYSGYDYDKTHVLYYRDLGLNFYEDGLYVLESFYNEHREIVEKFVRATVKGWEWLRASEKNRQKGLEIVMQELEDAHVLSGKNHQRLMLDCILRSQENGAGTATYVLEKSRYESCVKMLIDSKYLSKPVPYESFCKPFNLTK